MATNWITEKKRELGAGEIMDDTMALMDDTEVLMGEILEKTIWVTETKTS